MGKALRLSFVCVIYFGRSAEVSCRVLNSNTIFNNITPSFSTVRWTFSHFQAKSFPLTHSLPVSHFARMFHSWLSDDNNSFQPCGGPRCPKVITVFSFPFLQLGHLRRRVGFSSMHFIGKAISVFCSAGNFSFFQLLLKKP